MTTPMSLLPSMRATITFISRYLAPVVARLFPLGSLPCAMPCAWPTGVAPPALVDNRGAPDVAWIARLGAAAAEGYGPPRPLYLRAPDAQPQDAARLLRR